MKQIELLLTDNVDNLGIVGDVVKVKTGYARNYLVPRGLVTEPTEEAIAALAERRKQVEEELARRRAELEKMFEKLQEIELTIERSCNDQGVLYGGVSQRDVADALREDGFEIEDRMVRLGEQIKRVDSYRVPLQLAADLKTEVKLWVVADRPLPTEEELEAAEPEGEAETAEDEGEFEQPASSSESTSEASSPGEDLADASSKVADS